MTTEELILSIIGDYNVFDIEGDSLSPTKIYCMTVERHRKGQETTFITYTDYQDMIDALQEDAAVVGHNIILWDIPRLERILFNGMTDEREYNRLVRTGKIYPIRFKKRKIDTLALSWYLHPEYLKHGLDIYGEMFGVPKPKITDWQNQTLEEYIHRNREDVKINSKLLYQQIEELLEVYGEEDINGIIGYLMFKMDCAREQEEIKWKLDIDQCEANILMFESEIDKKTDILSNAMPTVISYKELNVPSKMVKANGELSKRGEAWLEVLTELGLPPDYSESIKLQTGESLGNPGSFTQIKDWLYTLGWVPESFKYEKEKDENGKDIVRAIPQLSLSKSAGGGICPSVKKLYDKEPTLEELENLFVLRHRRSVLKGFLRDVDEDGYLMAQVSGFTNTLRFKHSTIVNLPGVTGKHKPEEGIYDWKDGVHIRGCLIAPEGYLLAGSDMSSLEDRTKQHYMYFFDPEYVKQMIKPGFDPHLDLAIFAGAITEEQAEWFKKMSVRIDEGYKMTPEEKDKFNHIKKERGEHKTVNYAATYGSGADTMSRNSNMSVDRAKTLIKAYKKKNWSLTKIADSVVYKTVGNQMWLKNPVSGFWYTLRFKKDIFSTLNQGTGVYCFDCWTRESRSKGLQMHGQFHDEVVVRTTIEDKEKTELILREAIRTVNDDLQLNRELGVDVHFGESYADIH